MKPNELQEDLERLFEKHHNLLKNGLMIVRKDEQISSNAISAFSPKGPTQMCTYDPETGKIECDF